MREGLRTTLPLYSMSEKVDYYVKVECVKIWLHLPGNFPGYEKLIERRDAKREREEEREGVERWEEGHGRSRCTYAGFVEGVSFFAREI